MVRKTKEETLETRNQLLDAAEEVFYTKGYAQTTLMDVANHCGMTRGAIYWHFKNKVDLFEAMVDRVRTPLDALAEEPADENEADPLKKMREFSIQFLKDVCHDEQRRRVFTILFHRFETNGEVSELDQRQQTAFCECTDRIERGLKNAVNKGQLPQDLDTKKAALIKHGYFGGLMTNWLFMPDLFDLDSMAESIVDNYIFMLKNSPFLRKATAS
ncbi:TetR family transcriptional regulator [Catenovulum sp. 2E275]|uniref:TetR family transcriptional regulator n=1 Tax=Catenovulum sp. 2E275 TaxID=2980497 RepID=UPI0021CEAC73|nr:TetR family transcriptional regulator [Catenovulum sp. 2E275]MCU4676630.1 TetR family transcriptional regulator [Catenovulum sp. 2E275]